MACLMPKPGKGYKCSLIRIAAYCIVFFAYALKRKSEIILSLVFETVVNVVAISKSLASFATSVPFSLLNETTMSHFFPYRILLFFNNLRTAPRR